MNLETVRTRVALFLMDAGRLVWTEALLDEAIRHALEAYSRAWPRICSAVLTVLSGGVPVTLDLSGLEGFCGLLALRWPQQGENQLRGWMIVQAEGGWQALLLEGALPLPGEAIMAVYAAAHRLAGLDGATLTSVEDWHGSLLVRGAAAYAAQMRSVERSEGFLPEHGSQRLTEWAQAQMDAFQSELAGLRAQRGGVTGEPGRAGGWSTI